MILIISLLIYCIASIVTYKVMESLYASGTIEILRMPRKRWLYYLLSFTWGLPMNIIGAIVAGVLVCFRRRPVKYGWCLCFELPVNFGMELGIFFIAPVNGSEHTKKHELGHSIQNIYLGPLSVGVVSIPSAVRFWVREWKRRKGIELTTGYDDIWFEGQATSCGSLFMYEQSMEK